MVRQIRPRLDEYGNTEHATTDEVAPKKQETNQMKWLERLTYGIMQNEIANTLKNPWIMMLELW